MSLLIARQLNIKMLNLGLYCLSIWKEKIIKVVQLFTWLPSYMSTSINITTELGYLSEVT